MSGSLILQSPAGQALQQSAIPALQAITFEKKIDESLRAAANDALTQIKSKIKTRAGD